MIPKPDAAVASVLDSYPVAANTMVKALRKLIFTTAANIDGVGPLTETLKWGEPAYLTEKSKTGSTIRLGWKAKYPDQIAMYFICHTHLVDTFRTLYPSELRFEGNRAIVFKITDQLPVEEVAVCVGAALTYHKNKRK